jgi:hypothetical protein
MLSNPKIKKSFKNIRLSKQQPSLWEKRHNAVPTQILTGAVGVGSITPGI